MQIIFCMFLYVFCMNAKSSTITAWLQSVAKPARQFCDLMQKLVNGA